MVKNNYQNESSLLLKNSSDGWIKSVTTISTPHDGTTLAPLIIDIFPFAQSMSSWVAPFSNRFLKNIYSFDLDQWGLAADNNQKSKDFWKEIGKSNTAGPAEPPDRLAVLRSAFQKTMKDPAFLADAKRTRLDLEPIDHNAMRNVVSQLSGMPKETIARATKL